MRWEKINLAHGIRLVAASASALQEPRNTFRRSNLYHRFNGPKVNTKVEAGCTNHRFQFAFMQRFFHPWRSSCSMLPWWSAIAPARSGATFNNAWYQVSVIPLVLINISVVRLYNDRDDFIDQL